MYAALNQQGKLVYAVQVTQSQGQTWYCPTCHQEVVLRGGQTQKAHFAHRQGKCQSNATENNATQSIQSPVESAEHQAAKRLIGRMYQDMGEPVELEHYFMETGQYADVYLPRTQAVIEYQRSVLSEKTFGMRHRQYVSLGITPCWVFDAQILDDAAKTRWKQTVLQYSSEWGYLWKCLDVKAKQMKMRIMMPLVYSRLSYHTELIQTTLEMEQELFPTQVLDEWHHDARVESYQTLLARYRDQASGYLMTLYGKGFTLEDLPEWCITGKYDCLVSRTPGWVWLAWLWHYIIIAKKIERKIAPEDWTYYICQLILSNRVTLSQPILCERDILPDVCRGWWELFAEQGILDEVVSEEAFQVKNI